MSSFTNSKNDFVKYHQYISSCLKMVRTNAYLKEDKKKEKVL